MIFLGFGYGSKTRLEALRLARIPYDVSMCACAYIYVHDCLAARSLMCLRSSILRFRAPYVCELEHCRGLIGGRDIGAYTRALALWAPRGGATRRGCRLGYTGGTLSRPRVPVLAPRQRDSCVPGSRGVRTAVAAAPSWLAVACLVSGLGSRDLLDRCCGSCTSLLLREARSQPSDPTTTGSEV